jgi:hypothetical protein
MVARDVLELPSLTALDSDRDIHGLKFSKELRDWCFRPRHALTYALALEATDPSDPAVLLTAGVLARMAKDQPETRDEAEAVLRRILDRGLASQSPSTALSLAHGLREASRGVPRALRALGDDYTERAKEAILRPAAELIATLEQSNADGVDAAEKLQRIFGDLEADRRRLTEEHRKIEERSDRIDRGEATADDLASQEAIIQEAVERADAFDPAALEAEHEELPRKHREWKARRAHREAELEASTRDLQETRERLERLRRGRGTPEDLEWLRHQQSDSKPP